MRIGIFLFPEAELLDFCGPYEVFSAANIACEKPLFEVFTFAYDTLPVKSINGLKTVPDFDMKTLPVPEILVLPGGEGSRKVIADEEVMSGLNRLISDAKYVFSVCSGARILAKAGWLEKKKFTTHHLVFDDVQKLEPTARARPYNRFTDNGKILTSAGVSAGMDLSLYLTEKIHGSEVAEKTARYMEYEIKK